MVGPMPCTNVKGVFRSLMSGGVSLIRKYRDSDLQAVEDMVVQDRPSISHELVRQRGQTLLSYIVMARLLREHPSGAFFFKQLLMGLK